MVVVVSITLFFLGQQLQQTTLMAHLHIQPRCSTPLPASSLAKGALGSRSTQTTGQHIRVAFSWENIGKHLTAKPPLSLTVCRRQTHCRWVLPMQWYLNYQKRDKFITIPATPEAVLRLPTWKPSTHHLLQKHSQLLCHRLPSASPLPSRTCPATPSSSSAWQVGPGSSVSQNYLHTFGFLQMQVLFLCPEDWTLLASLSVCKIPPCLTEVNWDKMGFAKIKTAGRQRWWLAYQQFGARKCHLQFWVQ